MSLNIFCPKEINANFSHEWSAIDSFFVGPRGRTRSQRQEGDCSREGGGDFAVRVLGVFFLQVTSTKRNMAYQFL